MKLLSGVFFVFISSIVIAEQNKEGSMTPIEFIKAYENAISAQEWEMIDPLIHPNCAVTFTNGTYKGKSEVEGIFRKNFDLIKEEDYKISDVYFVIEEANYAIFIFKYTWSGLIHGQPAEGGGRGTSVLVKDNGGWQLISEHLGPDA